MMYTLRSANEARNKEWDASDKLDLSFSSNEMVGEVGEALEKAVDLLVIAIAAGRAANTAKKLSRERLGLRGSRATKATFAEELADIVICVDLLAMREGIDLSAAVADKFNKTSEANDLVTRLVL